MLQETSKTLSDNSSASKPTRPVSDQIRAIFSLGLIVAGCFGLFLALGAPGYAFRLSAERLDDYSTANSFYPKEAGADYAYTVPNFYLQFDQLPRYLPLKIDFELSLDRPTGTAPAQVEINEVDLPGYNVVRPLAQFQQSPAKTGFQTYSLIIPVRPGVDGGLNLQIKANPFQSGSDPNLRGVILRQMQVRAADSGFLQGDTILYDAAVLALLGLVGAWCWLVGVGYVEIAFLNLMIGLTCAEQVQQLHFYAPWLWLCLAGLAGCFIMWQTRRDRPTGGFGWIIGGLGCMSAFFILGNGFWGDLRLYQIWIADALKYGPFDFYHNSPTFNYLPLIVYFFYVYGQIAGLVGLAGNQLALKIVVSLSLPAMAWLVWHFLTKFGGISGASPGDRRKALPVFLLFGFNLAVLYNPVIWGQTEALLALFLLGSVYLIYRKNYWWALILLGLGLLLKLQAIMAGPLLLILVWKKAGWRTTVRGVGLSAFVCLALAMPVFGFQLSQISKYVFQGELGGQTVNYSRAYNFSYLTNYNFNPSNLVMVIGLSVIILVYLALARLIVVRELPVFTINLMLVLAIAVFFSFAIKMHERYLYYTLPFFLLASAYTYLDSRFPRQVCWLWLAFSLDGLLQLIFSRHVEIYALLDPTSGNIKAVNTVLENVYNWTGWLLDGRVFLETALSLATIGLCGWAAVLLWQTLKPKAPSKVETIPADS